MTLVVLLSVGCTKAKPVDIPVPEGIDLKAAAEIGDAGNGLWLLEGPVAASSVLDAMHAAGGGSLSASVRELIPVENGDPLIGRSITITSRTDGVNFAAELTVGDQHGELIVLGQQVWVRGNEAFSARVGVDVAAGGDDAVDESRATEDFVCLARGSTAIDELRSLADPAEFLRTTLIGLEMGVLGPSDAAPEIQTIVLGTGGSPTGELIVEASGAPLPQRLFVSDQSGTVQAAFAWGAIEEIRSPGNADACN